MSRGKGSSPRQGTDSGKKAGAKAAQRAAGRDRHPSSDIISTDGSELAGKKIVLCVAGSVAAYKAIELARLLMRHGADVTCVASKAATKLVRPAYLKWATGNDVVTELTGDLEHIRLADYRMSHMVVVYPATANTVGRLANGIDDTPVSTVLTVALGSKTPILICPAMHASMYDNPAVVRNIEFLERKKIGFVRPRIAESKAKAPEPRQVLGAILKEVGARPSPLRDRRVLITAGPTVEFIDPMRMITNRSSGMTGVLLASEFLVAGASVEMVYGPGRAEPPRGARVTRVETGSEMLAALRKMTGAKKFDLIIMAAAVSDYAPLRRSRTKLKSSAKERTIRLKRTPKIIGALREMQRDAVLVGFKAEADLAPESLARAARRGMSESGADLMVANDIGARYQRDPTTSSVLVVDRGGVRRSGWHKKENNAKFIVRCIEEWWESEEAGRKGRRRR